MDRRAESLSRRGENVHPRPRRAGAQAPRIAVGESRQELRLRYARRQAIARRSVRWQKPANRLSLYAGTRLGSRLPELLVSGRPLRWRRRSSGATGRLVSRRVAGAAVGNPSLPAPDGMALQLGVVVRQRFQFRLSGVVHARGENWRQGLLQLRIHRQLPERGTPGRQRVLQELRRRNLSHLFHLRPRSRYPDRYLSFPRSRTQGPRRRKASVVDGLGSPPRSL